MGVIEVSEFLNGVDPRPWANRCLTKLYLTLNRRMIRHTFQHLSGIGRHREIELWASGIQTWDDFTAKIIFQLEMFEESRSPHHQIRESIDALENLDTNYFAERLRAEEYYRVALEVPERVMFLDIETTGLSRFYDNITLVGWSFLSDYRVYYPGLDSFELTEALNRARVLVTFNGSLFDIPFIKQTFPEIRLPKCHIDLRFFARRFGFAGGQKAIEQEIGFRRSTAAKQVTGEFAPVLWHRYKEGSLSSLKKLITYNRYDIDGMKALLDVCIERSLRDVPLRIKPTKFGKYFTKRPTYTIGTTSETGIPLVEFSGRRGPTVRLDELPRFEELSIVGIDLTGSEARPSGWCHLSFNRAETRRIGSDLDLIESTLAVNPTVVSIDSPLSMPKGRISVFDDDPGRFEFGIMRECERMLKRRGVNVYPSLIPSMQRLTQRGMLLARELRARGVAVIESYPGAAQDILGIPRKQQSLEYLIKGLAEFGLVGPFTESKISHDELDAITSAMLAYFFWCGRFEALGNDEEDYLIIPDTSESFEPWHGKHVIGLSGGLSSGKTTAGEFLKTKGYAYGRLSMVIAHLAEQQGLFPSRSNLQYVGEYVNKQKGQRWLCRELLHVLPSEAKTIVIDGLRFPDDHAYLRETFGPNFLHIHMVCNDELRSERYKKSESNDVDFETAISHPVEGQVRELSKLANAIIVNESHLYHLYRKLEEHII